MKKFTLIFLLLLVICGNSFAQFTKIVDFDGASKGAYPYGSLYYDGTFLYGTTSIGGINNIGTVFKVKPDGTGFVKLLDFAGTTNGSNPYGSLIYDGNYLYGMTVNGGTNNLGTIFKIKSDGTGYIKLLDFNGTTNGANPWGSLISDGTFLYGMTFGGGANSMGTIFKIKTDGTGYTKLFEFAGLSIGRNPKGNLFLEGDYLYGMTSVGGSDNFGVVFKIKTDGTGFTKLLEFDSVTKGKNPYGTLISDGVYLYGMTSGSGVNSSSSFGTIFKIKPDGTGFFKLMDFDGATKGKNPYGSLLADGTFLYGMTFSGGADNWGTLFKIKNDGTGFTKLMDFGGVASGMNPWGSLISVGTNLYGMTSGGGSGAFSGILFKYGVSTLGVSKNLWQNSIKIYPNPSSGNFNIEIDGNSIGSNVVVYDLLGRKIEDFTLKSTKSKLTLNQGIYLLEIENEGNKFVKKLIVN